MENTSRSSSRGGVGGGGSASAASSAAEAARAARRSRIAGGASSPTSTGGGAGSAAAIIAAGGKMNGHGSGARNRSRPSSSGGGARTALDGAGTGGGSSRRQQRRAASAGNQRVSASSSVAGAGAARSASAQRAASPAIKINAGRNNNPNGGGGGGGINPAAVAAAFDDLGGLGGTGGARRASGRSRNIIASNRSGGGASTATQSAQQATDKAAKTNAPPPRGGGGASLDLSPQAVAEEYVSKSRQHQQTGVAAAPVVVTMNGRHGPANNNTTTTGGATNRSTTASSSSMSSTAAAAAVRNNVSPARSRNTAAVRNYVSGRAQSPPSSPSARAGQQATGTGTTSSRADQTRRTQSTSTGRRAAGTSRVPTAQATTAQKNQNQRQQRQQQGSLAASSPASDSLPHSNTNSSRKGSRSGIDGGGGGGQGGDLLSGQATNDIPSPERNKRKQIQQQQKQQQQQQVRLQLQQLQPPPQPIQQQGRQQQAQQQQRRMPQQAPPTPDTSHSGYFVDDNDDGTQTSKYDDLSKLSSRYSGQDRLTAPAEKIAGANPNQSSASYDSFEIDNATAIVYGSSPEGGGGASIGGISQGGLSQSFSPGPGVSVSPSQSTGGGMRTATFDDEDTHSQLTDDRSWSRAVNLRQQHLMGLSSAKDKDPSSVRDGGLDKPGKGTSSGDANGDQELTGWALNADDWKHFKEQVDQPQVKGALGASAAVVAGAAVFGPVGVLVGAAAVGIGVGVMQIPEDQRETMKERATSAAQQTYESAQIAADAMGTTCATACAQSGVAEKIDPKLAKFCSDGAENGCVATIGASDLMSNNPCVQTEASSPDGQNAVGGSAGNGGAGVSTSRHGATASDSHRDGTNTSSADDSANGDQLPKRRRKVACMRKGRIIPVGQIHSLDPSRQPRAWLDVMASMNTTREEKDEAMEELMIFIKDKNTAHVLLEEGILDSLIYIITCLFRKYTTVIARDSPDGSVPSNILSDPEFLHAKKAANCCVNLGKAHCAIVHTEGDLLLMSAYSNGAVPVERQLAQMLYEIPHHTSVPMAPGKALIPEGEVIANDVFTLTELSLQHAERLAKSILALSQGKIVT